MPPGATVVNLSLWTIFTVAVLALPLVPDTSIAIANGVDQKVYEAKRGFFLGGPAVLAEGGSLVQRTQIDKTLKSCPIRYWN